MELRRRGKYILFQFADRLLVIHLRMSGRLEWGRKLPADRVRLSFRFPTGTVYLVDRRRLAQVEVMEHFERVLGPEPLGDLGFLHFATRNSRAPIKAWLLDQRNIAGIGNIYAAEILFRAGIDPRRPAASLAEAEVERLRIAIPEVLTEAIAAMGTTLTDATWRGPKGELGTFGVRLSVYGRAGEPCPVCNTPIQRVEIGGRGTYFCPTCQR
jgi:formamidopyrimidine-DNA glycosylase